MEMQVSKTCTNSGNNRQTHKLKGFVIKLQLKIVLNLQQCILQIFCIILYHFMVSFFFLPCVCSWSSSWLFLPFLHFFQFFWIIFWLFCMSSHVFLQWVEYLLFVFLGVSVLFSSNSIKEATSTISRNMNIVSAPKYLPTGFCSFTC